MSAVLCLAAYLTNTVPPQEVGVHVIASAEALQANPLPHAVASYPLKEAAAAIRGGGVSLPEGAGRFVVSVDGTESEEDITALKVGSCNSAE